LAAHIELLETTVRQNHPQIQLGESAFGFQEYTHRGIQRFEVLLDPTSSLYQLVCDGLEHQWMDMVCRYLNRDRSQLRRNVSCVYSRPGATDQDWHTDGDHYPAPNGRDGDDDDDTPYALCVFVPLIALTAETGFTRFWPKSHRYPNLLGLARAADALQATVDGVNLHPGDFILYDYTTWHKGVGNTSCMERPVLQFLYSADWYVERKNYGTKSVFDTS
jgi:Phytanoyl-CoA dioxygenase (PhyH)